PLIGIDLGEEGIRLKSPMDPGEFQIRGKGHGLAIDFPSSDDIGRFIFPDKGNGILKGVDQGTGKFWNIVFVPADGNVLTVGKGLWEALQGLASHDDLVSRDQGLEAFEIVRKPPNQIIVLPQGIVFPGSGYEDQSPHPSFFLLIEGRGNSVAISFRIWEIRSLCWATRRSRGLRSQAGPMSFWVTKKLKAWMADRKLQRRMAQTNQS